MSTRLRFASTTLATCLLYAGVGVACSYASVVICSITAPPRSWALRWDMSPDPALGSVRLNDAPHRGSSRSGSWQLATYEARGYRRDARYEVAEQSSAHAGGSTGSSHECTFATTEAGWPFRCAWSVEIYGEDPDSMDRTIDSFGSFDIPITIDIGGPMDLPHPVPMLPIPLPLLCNVAVYGLAAWGCVQLPKRLMQRARRRRAACIAC